MKQEINTLKQQKNALKSSNEGKKTPKTQGEKSYVIKLLVDEYYN